MNRLVLPLFFSSFKFNNLLFKFLREDTDRKKFDFIIESNSGAYPYSYFNGDVNSNFGKLALNNDFYLCPDKNHCVLRYDFSNIFLEEIDFFSVHENAILKMGENGSNQIELSNLLLLKYIEDSYDNYKFVFSKNADLISEFNPEIIDYLAEQNKFDLISLPSYYNNDDEFLSKINHKNMVEINIGEKCSCSKSTQKSCLIQENQNQIDFSGRSVFQNCSKTNNYNNSNELMEEIATMNKKGFTHFRVETPPWNKIDNFLFYLIKNLIKEEYQVEFIEMFEQSK